MTFALSEPTGEPRDPGDVAADLAEVTREIALRRHLAAVEITEDQAIDEDGRVWCLDCPAQIPPERLALVPHAVRCHGCQEVHELAEAQKAGKRGVRR
jgi:RNA polymerase-binding transcription factor DksA